MSRLPIPGGDTNNWGSVLNDFLAQSHNADGSLKTDSVGAAALADNTVTNTTISISADIDQSKIHDLTGDLATKEPTITATTSADYYRGDKTFQTLDKAAVGLGNVDNTSDVSKPVSTATQIALNAKLDTATATTTYAPFITAGRYAGVGICNLGDSITSNYGNSTSTGADGYLTWGLIAAGARLPFRGSFGAGGYTLEQIRDSLLPQVLSLSPLPAICVVLGGTNNVPSSSSTAVLHEIYNTLLHAGIRPIACTIPPRGDGATANNNVDSYNYRVRAVAASLGLDLVDFHRVLVDVNTGGYKAGLGQTDGIHPSYLGTKKMGDELAALLVTRLPAAVPPLARRKLEYGNLIGSAGLMLSDVLAANNNTAGDGIADNWRSFGSSANTYSIVTDSDGTKWQRVVIPTSGGSVNLQYNASGVGGPSVVGVVAPNDVVELVARVRTSGFEENLVAPVSSGVGGTGPNWSMFVDYLQTDGSTYGSVIRNPYVGHVNISDGVIWAQARVPANANGTLRISFTTSSAPTTGTLTIDVTSIAIRNLTALGLQ